MGGIFQNKQPRLHVSAITDNAYGILQRVSEDYIMSPDRTSLQRSSGPMRSNAVQLMKIQIKKGRA